LKGQGEIPQSVLQ